jgi:NosR/NirI family nitrous oxide reductase transcriptional regulator
VATVFPNDPTRDGGKMSDSPKQVVPLTVLLPAPARGARLRSLALRLYRLGIVCAIVFIIHRHHTRLRIDGGAQISLDEVRPFFATASRLEADTSERAGLFVLDKSANPVGYVLRTSPTSDKIKGYAGPTDTLLALDYPGMKVLGIKIRSSWDTKVHVKDVGNDEYFMNLWTGKTWDEVAGLDPRTAHIEGVSGASLTSLAIANAIQHRFKLAKDAAAAKPPPVHLRPHDWGLVAVIALALAFTFVPHLRSHTWARRAFQVVLIGYVGFWNGQILAQSLMSGWSASGVAWRTAPALALLLAAALVVPWTSRRAIYCSQICPHGAAQEWVGRLSRRKLRVPRGLDRGLRWLPPLLIAFVLTITMWQLPIDLADVEPFDAYLIRTASLATIVIAVAGLVAAAFVPMAYCKYGCPTGLILSFVRSHGRADTFGRRDYAAGLLVLLTVGLYASYGAVHHWIVR